MANYQNGNRIEKKYNKPGIANINFSEGGYFGPPAERGIDVRLLDAEVV